MKKRLVFFAVFSICLLSGCSTENIEEKPKELMKQYLLYDNAQYNDYLAMEQLHAENIDGNGYYVDDQLEQTEIDNHEGTVHVSFASHNLLNVTYYSDPEHSIVIDKQNCYLYPGDSIYAKVDSTSLIQSNTYEFYGFQIAAFDGDQANYDYASFEGEVITIPNDIQYKEISIIPNGNYMKRELSFNAEFEDIDGNTVKLSPVWIVNVGDQSYSTKSNSYSLESNAAFRVKVQYDPTEYYFIEEKAEPKCESYSEDTGTVTFMQYDPQNAVNDYKLSFGKNFNFKIEMVKANGPITIWIDGKNYDTPTFPFTASARIGAEVQIKGNITEIGAVENLTRLTQNGYVYAVFNGEDSIDFDPSIYSYPNGKVVFYDVSHKEIKEKTELKIGDVIYYVGQADDGYTFNMGEQEQKINVDSNIDYMLKNELKFSAKETIALPQPDKGGKITYYLNGKEVKADSSYFAAGTDRLTASFHPAERYKVNNLSDQTECIVSSSDHRIKFKDNDGKSVSIDKVFELSTSQKASLNVSLDDSVGTEIKFNIFNGSTLTNPDKKKYTSKELFDNWKNPLGLDDNELLKDYKIETVSGLKITVSDWSPLRDEAIRIEVVKSDAAKKKTNEIYYILSGSGTQSISTDSGDSTYYTDISVKISKVKGSKFNKKDYKYENGNVIISYNDTSGKTQIKDGEFVDNNREVRIILKANESYQVYQKSQNPFSKSYNVVEKYETTCKYNKLDEKWTDVKTKTKIQY